MPGTLYHVGASASCPHGGVATVVPSAPRVFVSGQPVATLTSTTLIAGCTFQVSGKPQPCVRVQWTVGTARVFVMGQPALNLSSIGLCLSAEQAPQGPPIIVSTQPRALGT